MGYVPAILATPRHAALEVNTSWRRLKDFAIDEFDVLHSVSAAIVTLRLISHRTSSVVGELILYRFNQFAATHLLSTNGSA